MMLFLRSVFALPVVAFGLRCASRQPPQCTNVRPPPSDRNFVSEAVDSVVSSLVPLMRDDILACIFSNSFPNTLDTTVAYAFDGEDGPRSFVITGDIQAMWTRDSTNQLLPYLPMLGRDPHLAHLFAGAVRTQTSQILADPWANAHYDIATNMAAHASDTSTKPCFQGMCDAMSLPGIFERKYELDSLCAFLKLSRSYFFETRDETVYDATWLRAVRTVYDVMRVMQRSSAEEAEKGAVYTFTRDASMPTDTLLHGVGSPAARTGMVRSAFRPSDDATTFPFLVPSNAMAVVELRFVASMLDELAVPGSLATELRSLADEIDEGIRAHAIVERNGVHIFAYEVDGFGNALVMDDANVPSLLSLPYLGYIDVEDDVYQATREVVLSTANPWFFKGSAGEGVGGPHIGLNYIWPMAIIVRGLTSHNDSEIMTALETLKESTAGTGLMHESFHKDDAGSYTRSWFAWANALFGELILKLAKERPQLILSSNVPQEGAQAPRDSR